MGFKKIKQKKYIFYSSDSQVFHYHGSHHQNDIERLKKQQTPYFKSRNFNLNDKSLNFGKIDVFPIIIHNNISISKLNFNVKKLNNTFKSKKFSYN